MKRIFTIFALAALAASCSGPSFELGKVPDNKSPKYSVTPDADSPNIIRFTFDEEQVSPFWKIRKPDGGYLESSSRDFTLRYFMKGEYDGTLTVYGSGGMGEPIPFTFMVTDNDPVVQKLTGDGEQKALVESIYAIKAWNPEAHFGEGAWVRKYHDVLLVVGRKNGKAIALDTKIPTPDGWKQMRDIHVGDYVYAIDGVPAKVLVESPVRENHDCYRISFEDGADAEIVLLKRKGKIDVRSTSVADFIRENILK